MLVESKQQARAVLTSDDLPWKASESTLERPKEIETDTRGVAFGASVRSDGAEPAKLSDGGDTGTHECVARLGPEIRQLSDGVGSGLRHTQCVAWRAA